RSRVLTTASRKPVSTSSLGGTPLTFAVFLHQLLAHDLAHLGVGGRGEIEGSGSHSLHHPLAEPALLLGVLLSGQRARALGQPLGTTRSRMVATSILSSRAAASSRAFSSVLRRQL